jgi:hypothetical protein
MFQTRGSDHAPTYRATTAQRHEREAAEVPRVLRPLSEADARSEAALIAYSLHQSHARIAGALAVYCDNHDAAPGAYCWATPNRVRGICLDRYQCGVAAPVRSTRQAADDLAELARAARFAHRDARLRLNARHPNRHPVTTPRVEVAR